MNKHGIEATISLAQKMAATRGWDEDSEYLQPRAVPIADVVGDFMKPSEDFSVELKGTIWLDTYSDSKAFTLLASPLTSLFEYTIEGRDSRSNLDLLPTPWSNPHHGSTQGNRTYVPRGDMHTPPSLVFFQRLPIWGQINNSSPERLVPTEAWYLPIGFTIVRCTSLDGFSSTDMIIDHWGRYLVFYRQVVNEEKVVEMRVTQAQRKQDPRNSPLVRNY